MAYVEWGTRIALANSQPGADPPPEAPVPRWGWGEAPPHGRARATGRGCRFPPYSGVRCDTRRGVRVACEHVFVRWENLRVEQRASATPARLSGAGGRAHLRRAGGARTSGSTRSAPSRRSTGCRSASRMPFRWTINPYRGCTHACAYCAVGRHADPDGRRPDEAARRCARRRRDLRHGAPGRYRRYVTHRGARRTGRPSSRHTGSTLEDGTELVTSGDHRFLTDRGWKHVTGAEHGAGRRPHLTVNNKLMGTGRFACAPRRLTRLPPRIPLRDGPGRRPPRVRTPTSARAAVARRRPSVPPRAHGFRGAAAGARVPARPRRRDRRVRIPGGSARESSR